MKLTQEDIETINRFLESNRKLGTIEIKPTKDGLKIFFVSKKMLKRCGGG